jgi:hypothetical protein
MDKSPRPKANPRLAKGATSPRPKPRSKAAEDAAFEAEMTATVARGNKNAQPPRQPGKMAKGGMCRGMGAAKRGGKYKAM